MPEDPRDGCVNPHEQNATHVPPHASQILVAVMQMPYPIGDVRVAKAVSVLPLEHPSLGDVRHRQIIRTRDGLIRAASEAVRLTGRALRRAAGADRPAFDGVFEPGRWDNQEDSR